MTVAVAASALQTPPQARDRFLAFAFAAAEMLVETGMDGVITFAAGAFRPRFGREGGQFIGRHIASLIAPGDQAGLAMAMAGLQLRGRISPVVLRTSDPAQTPSTLAAMLMPGPPARVCYTIGLVPIPAVDHAADAAAGGAQRRFEREVEAQLRAGTPGTLGLVEFKGWAAARERMAPEAHRALRASIADILSDGAPGAVSGEISDGKFGVIAGDEREIAAMVTQLEKLLHASAAGRSARIECTGLKLDHESLSAPQAARALRYALSRFSEGGAEAAAATGATGGLAGIIAQAEMRAQGVRDAIEGRRFRLQFQPVVNLATRRVQHYEALLRPIATPGNPAPTTQDFVTFAEAVGLSEALDWAVLEEALAAIRATPNAAVAVNISGLSMQSAAFRARIVQHVGGIADLLRANGGHRLVVELTETAEIEDLQGASASIAQLRACGVPVCLDDFGAGAAAFRYLQAFQVDFVKIDGSYVRAAASSTRERGFVVSMVELAHSVGAKVVAEMIETEEQAVLMQSLGVEEGQGWLFGRPGVLPGARR
jgi:EAL domain-containing protein (putative c-di-GMP-specific phosphodiesterase class I)